MCRQTSGPPESPAQEEEDECAGELGRLMPLPQRIDGKLSPEIRCRNWPRRELVAHMEQCSERATVVSCEEFEFLRLL